MDFTIGAVRVPRRGGRSAGDGGEPDARWLSILVCKKRKSYRGDRSRRARADGGAKAAFDATRATFLAERGLD